MSAIADFKSRMPLGSYPRCTSAETSCPTSNPHRNMRYRREPASCAPDTILLYSFSFIPSVKEYWLLWSTNHIDVQKLQESTEKALKKQQASQCLGWK